MDFRTTFDIPISKSQISLHSKILTIGSCFSDVIGNQLFDSKIEVSVNPFGTVFNPNAIFKLLNQSILKKNIDENHFLENDGLWYNYDFHSKFNNRNKTELKAELEEIQNQVSEKLEQIEFLIITLGTSFAYQHLETKSYVANCHKMPAQLFRKDLLHVKHICQEFEQFYKNIKALNPAINIILSVSPVRHIKDGVPDNQVSKSILRAACHYLCLDFEGVNYFPAYEIMMDDLRDYRFYEADLIHPNNIAETYIIEKFSDAYFDKGLLNFVKDWSKIKADLNHRPFNEKSTSQQKFLHKLLQKLENISKIVNVEKEKEAILSRIFV